MDLYPVYKYFESYSPKTSDYDVFSARGSEAKEEDLTRYEESIGFRLPDDFREFSKSYLGGLYMAAKEEIWPRHKEGDVGPFWSFLYGIIVFGFSEDAPDFIDMTTQTNRFHEDFGRVDLVPFMKQIGNADRYCFDSKGQVYEFYHDDIENPQPFEGAFADLLLKEIKDLEDRTERKRA